MLVTLLAIGFFDPIIDFYAILALGVLHSFFASTQDVAGDGLVRRILAPHERPTGMSVQAAAGLIGNILGGGLVMAAYPHIGWRGCTTILMFAVAACLVQVTLFKEPPDLDRQPQVSPKRIISFWKEPGNFAWLALMAPFCLGVGLGWGALPVLMTDRGFGYEQIGLTLNGIGSFAGLIGAIIFGAVMRRSPRSRMLNLMGWSLIGSYGLVFLLVTSFKANSAFIAAVQVYFLGTSASMVLIPTIMLDRASKSTPATDFTIQFCALTVFQHLGGGLATVIVGLRGPVGILFFPMVLAAAGLFLGRLFLGKGLLSLDQALESEGERFEVEREMRK
jgi:MFS family permease